MCTDGLSASRVTDSLEFVNSKYRFHPQEEREPAVVQTLVVGLWPMVY